MLTKNDDRLKSYVQNVDIIKFTDYLINVLLKHTYDTFDMNKIDEKYHSLLYKIIDLNNKLFIKNDNVYSNKNKYTNYDILPIIMQDIDIYRFGKAELHQSII